MEVLEWELGVCPISEQQGQRHLETFRSATSSYNNPGSSTPTGQAPFTLLYKTPLARPAFN